MLNSKSQLSTNARTSQYIYIQLVLSLLIIFFTMMGIPSIVSLLFTATFLVLALNLIHFLLKGKINNDSAIDVGLLFFIILTAFVAVLSVSDGNLSYGYYRKYIMFCSTLIFLFIIGHVVVNRKLIVFIFKLNIALVVAYFLFYTFGNAPYYAGGLTLNFTNPNLLALFLMHSLLYLIISLLYFKTKIGKWVLIFGLIVISILIFETRTRAVMLSLAFYLILFIFIYLNKKFKIGRVFTLIIVLYPLIFAIIYMNVIYNPNVIDIFDFMISEGKTLSSRYYIWEYSFEVIRNNWVFGDYFLISGGTGVSQLHNTHIDIMASYGSLVFVAFIIYLYRTLTRISKNCESKIQKISLVAFLAIVIMGSGEAALVSGGIGMYILSCLFLLIARYRE